MIEVLQGLPTPVLAFACKNHVTRSDYEATLIPVVEKAMQQPGKVRLYYQINPDFTGIEMGAAWDDFKVGMHHLTRWERMAVVTDVDWIRYAIRAFGFVMPGDLRIFPLAEKEQAREWITQGLTPSS